MTAPVCDVCKDTHEVTTRRDGYEDRVIMCTSCPTPCDNCRQGAGIPGQGLGPYCSTTPCPCGCHKTKSWVEPEPSRASGERKRIAHQIQTARAILDSIEATVDAGVTVGPGDAQAIAHAGVDIACALARLWAYQLKEGDAAAKVVKR